MYDGFRKPGNPGTISQSGNFDRTRDRHVRLQIMHGFEYNAKTTDGLTLDSEGASKI